MSNNDISKQSKDDRNSNDLVHDVTGDVNHRDDNDGQQLLYTIEDIPPWYMCIFLGFQHYLTMFGSTVAAPFVLFKFLGIAEDNVAKGQLISTFFFVSGISTLLQTTLGCRLPIVQGAAFAFISPAIAIMQSIPNPSNSTNGTTEPVPPDFWKTRMVQVQGAIMVASCTQVFLGATGIIGMMMSRIGPITIAPTITLVGLSLFGAAGHFAGKHWGIAILTIFLIILFSQYLKNIEIPLIPCSKDRGQPRQKIKIFGLFPVIYAVLLSWIFCVILTAAGAFPPTSEARTDTRIGVLAQASWFRVPYPGQWGLPVVTLPGVLGMISGVLASIIESVGDYYACARLCYAESPPTHAINRGVFMEGIGCIIAGAIGTGNGTTSYSENIGAIGITKVGSRRVVQVGAVIMLVLSVIGKFGALFTTIPDPVVGGMFCVMFGMITGVGISTLQYVDLNSSRNTLIVGLATFMGICVPNWINDPKNSALIKTGSTEFDQILLVLLSTGMFVGGVLAFLLDNTIPGTIEERGLLSWRTKISQTSQSVGKDSVYDFPGPIQRKIEMVKGFRYIPICPNFSSPRVFTCEEEVTPTHSIPLQPTSSAVIEAN